MFYSVLPRLVCMLCPGPYMRTCRLLVVPTALLASSAVRCLRLLSLFLSALAIPLLLRFRSILTGDSPGSHGVAAGLLAAACVLPCTALRRAGRTVACAWPRWRRFRCLGFAVATGLRPSARRDRKSTRLNSSHSGESRMPSSA